MLIPRFGIRQMLLGTALAAVLAYLLSHAVAGRHWATAVTMGLATLLVTFMLFAATFGLCQLLAFTRRRLVGEKQVSPFAGDEPPPQLLRPMDPET